MYNTILNVYNNSMNAGISPNSVYQVSTQKTNILTPIYDMQHSNSTITSLMKTLTNLKHQ